MTEITTSITTSPIKKSVSKKKRGETIYLLFDVEAFGNSTDLAYELDYAYAGAYRNKRDAFLYFVTTLLEREIEGVDEKMFFDESGILLENVNESLLESYGWKLIESTIS